MKSICFCKSISSASLEVAIPILCLTSTRTTFLQLSSARLAIFAFFAFCTLLFFTPPLPLCTFYSGQNIRIQGAILPFTSPLLSVFSWFSPHVISVFLSSELDIFRQCRHRQSSLVTARCGEMSGRLASAATSNKLQFNLIAQSVWALATLKLIPQGTECLRWHNDVNSDSSLVCLWKKAGPRRWRHWQIPTLSIRHVWYFIPLTNKFDVAMLDATLYKTIY